MLTVCAANYSTNTVAGADLSASERLSAGDEAVQIARTISWRAGEAFAHLTLSWSLGKQGNYRRALTDAQAGLEIAEAIVHHQWTTAAHWTLGALYLDLLHYPEAQQHLERAFRMAQEIGSLIWVNHASGLLASTYMAQEDQAGAAAILGTLPADLPVQTLGQRQCWVAWAQLALVREDAASALSIADKLIDSPLNNGQAVPDIGWLRGQALARLGRLDEAEQTLVSAEQGAIQGGLLPTLWRIQVALGKLYQTTHESSVAEQAMSQAQETIANLARNIDDDQIRGVFLNTAQLMTSLAPSQRPLGSPSRGLTVREQEVARWVAQGLSNRAIAGELVVGERTIESHVSSILSKLGFSSRAQIIAWVSRQGSNSLDTRP